jgi:1-acyl-sn-glycerol-3-phosphate acyltransferase
MEKAQSWVCRGVSVLFFPEGTRSPDGEIHEFKPGAFKVALEEKAEILPIVITGTRDVIRKHSWVVRQQTELGLEVLEPVSTQGISLENLNGLREKVENNIRTQFEKKRRQTHV